MPLWERTYCSWRALSAAAAASSSERARSCGKGRGCPTPMRGRTRSWEKLAPTDEPACSLIQMPIPALASAYQSLLTSGPTLTTSLPFTLT